MLLIARGKLLVLVLVLVLVLLLNEVLRLRLSVRLLRGSCRCHRVASGACSGHCSAARAGCELVLDRTAMEGLAGVGFF